MSQPILITTLSKCILSYTLIFTTFIFSSFLSAHPKLLEEAQPSITPELAHTDGIGLEPKLPPLSKAKQKSDFELAKNACLSQCVTPFGKLLGTANGVKSFSNCRSNCVVPKYSFMNLKTKSIEIGDKNPNEKVFHYIGVIHQCVEYARKWWMINKGITFGSIDSAFEIIYLSEGKNIYNNETFPLARSINGSAKRAPQKGDLIIYSADRERPNWKHGHVAVVVDINLEKGEISIAEENYNNQPWDDPTSFARKLKISKTKSGYHVLDQDNHQPNSELLGKISGWIYPL